MSKFKNYLINFVKDEEGMEALQFVVIIVIAAALIPVLWHVKGTIADNMNRADEAASTQMQNIIDETRNAN